MFKKIFIYSLFFTFHLESIEGRKFTSTKLIGDDDLEPDAIVVTEFFESRGEISVKGVTEFKMRDLDNMLENERTEVLENNEYYKYYDARIEYKALNFDYHIYGEIKKVEVPKGRVKTQNFYYPNGNIWVKWQTIDAVSDFTKECWDEKGNLIEDMFSRDCGGMNMPERSK